MTALRQFLSRREAEILEQMKLLDQELAEIRATWATLQGGGGPPPRRASQMTIKEMIRSILRSRPDGLAAGEILQEIQERFSVAVERTSLSPQLSRLRDSGDVTLVNARWYSTQIDLAELGVPEAGPRAGSPGGSRGNGRD
jgi:hypothetical protein